jgi:hypothetical protein
MEELRYEYKYEYKINIRIYKYEKIKKHTREEE